MLSNKQRKALLRASQPMLEHYGAIDLDIIPTIGKHPYALVAFDSATVVRVNRVPNTSSTPARFIAQNILKAARAALNQNMPTACYGGGKG